MYYSYRLKLNCCKVVVNKEVSYKLKIINNIVTEYVNCRDKL
jgi:hypothetical protein